jgi:hypothetical protein
MARPSAARGRFAVAGALACLALAVPATASAADPPQRLGAAPGGDSFVVIEGTPYVAYASKAGVRVARFTNASPKWAKVGKPVRHSRRTSVRQPDLAVGPGNRPWLTWIEGTNKTGRQVRVARLVRGKWREVVGGKRPISKTHTPNPEQNITRYMSREPTLAFLKGRPYVAYLDGVLDPYITVVRLSKNRRKWEHRNSWEFMNVGSSRPSLTNVAGKLFLTANTFLGPGTFVVHLNGTKWEGTGNPELEGGTIEGPVAFGGELHLLRDKAADLYVVRISGDQSPAVGNPLAADETAVGQELATDGTTLFAAFVSGPDAARELTVSFLNGSTWEALGAATPEGSTTTSAQLEGAAGGGVWVLAREKTQGKVTFQLELYGATP